MEYIKQGLEIAPEKAEFHTLHIALLNAMNKRDEAYELTNKYINDTDSPVKIMEMKGFMMNRLVNERDDIVAARSSTTRKDIRANWLKSFHGELKI